MPKTQSKRVEQGEKVHALSLVLKMGFRFKIPDPPHPPPHPVPHTHSSFLKLASIPGRVSRRW